MTVVVVLSGARLDVRLNGSFNKWWLTVCKPLAMLLSFVANNVVNGKICLPMRAVRAQLAGLP
jgi:hypothetical protein